MTNKSVRWAMAGAGALMIGGAVLMTYGFNKLSRIAKSFPPAYIQYQELKQTAYSLENISKNIKKESELKSKLDDAVLCAESELRRFQEDEAVMAFVKKSRRDTWVYGGTMMAGIFTIFGGAFAFSRIMG